MNDLVTYSYFSCFNFKFEILNANLEANLNSLFSLYSLTGKLLIFLLLDFLQLYYSCYRTDANDIVCPSSSISESCAL